MKGAHRSCTPQNFLSGVEGIFENMVPERKVPNVGDWSTRRQRMVHIAAKQTVQIHDQMPGSDEEHDGGYHHHDLGLGLELCDENREETAHTSMYIMPPLGLEGEVKSCTV